MLMDGRAWTDPDDAMVMFVGSKGECCAAANDGEYGDGCVVCRPDGQPAFELFQENGKWGWNPKEVPGE